MSSLTTVQDLIETYGLIPHPEGGYFKESYRSDDSIPQTALPSRFSGPRSFSTAIYYLLPKGAVSRLHRIASDEVWHFYLGGPLVLIELISGGKIRKTTIGQNLTKGEVFQYVVKAGVWFGAYPEVGTEFSFVGCTVAPGFDFADFEMADRELIASGWPSVAEFAGSLKLQPEDR